ncbi:MAG: hypothetical protein RLZZ499_942, partial [Cyanobacteriota bacterium]
MLFNSFEFIFLFLPITLAVFFWLSNKSKYVEQQLRSAFESEASDSKRDLPIIWLVLASFFFYGWWQLHSINLFLLTTSILFNYSLGYCLSNVVKNALFKKAIVIFGIV